MYLNTLSIFQTWRRTASATWKWAPKLGLLFMAVQKFRITNFSECCWDSQEWRADTSVWLEGTSKKMDNDFIILYHSGNFDGNFQRRTELFNFTIQAEDNKTQHTKNAVAPDCWNPQNEASQTDIDEMALEELIVSSQICILGNFKKCRHRGKSFWNAVPDDLSRIRRTRETVENRTPQNHLPVNGRKSESPHYKTRRHWTENLHPQWMKEFSLGRRSCRRISPGLVNCSCGGVPGKRLRSNSLTFPFRLSLSSANVPEDNLLARVWGKGGKGKKVRLPSSAVPSKKTSEKTEKSENNAPNERMTRSLSSFNHPELFIHRRKSTHCRNASPTQIADIDIANVSQHSLFHKNSLLSMIFSLLLLTWIYLFLYSAQTPSLLILIARIQTRTTNAHISDRKGLGPRSVLKWHSEGITWFNKHDACNTKAELFFASCDGARAGKMLILPLRILKRWPRRPADRKKRIMRATLIHRFWT